MMGRLLQCKDVLFLDPVVYLSKVTLQEIPLCLAQTDLHGHHIPPLELFNSLAVHDSVNVCVVLSASLKGPLIMGQYPHASQMRIYSVPLLRTINGTPAPCSMQMKSFGLQAVPVTPMYPFDVPSMSRPEHTSATLWGNPVTSSSYTSVSLAGRVVSVSPSKYGLQNAAVALSPLSS